MIIVWFSDQKIPLEYDTSRTCKNDFSLNLGRKLISHQLSADQKLITNDQQSIKNDQLQMVSGKLLFWLRFIEKWRRINEKWLKCLIDRANFIDQLHKWEKVN